MPTTQSNVSSTRRKSSAARPLDAIELLTNDHKSVKALFVRFNKLAKSDAPAGELQALADTICEMLSVHAQIEEEILYPAARAVLPEENLVDEATVEHASAKDLIAQIRSMRSTDELFDAKVKVLGEYIDHHVKEEQDEMFPKLRRRLDVKTIGAELLARKEELMVGSASTH
ncbi:MAG: hemerythrin domain-containing protein [Burkholderiales bacterium]